MSDIESEIKIFQELRLNKQDITPKMLEKALLTVRGLSLPADSETRKWLWLLSTVLLNSKGVEEGQKSGQECLSLLLKLSMSQPLDLRLLKSLFSYSNNYYRYVNQDKTYRCIFGHPLSPYSPSPNQHCDLVRPKLSSVAPCLWTRCQFLAWKTPTTCRVLDYAGQEQQVSDPWFAPLGTRSVDFQWRMSLQEGMLVDVQDNKQVWYESTVLKSFQKAARKFILIGYRTYCQDGDKTDNQGRVYKGWKELYDEQFQVTSPRVMQHKRMAKKLYTPASFPNSEVAVQDSSDMIFEHEFSQKKCYAILRPTYSKSLTLINLFNQFADRGGLDQLIRVIGHDNNYNMCEALSILSTLHFIYPRMVVKQLTDRVLQAVQHNLFKSKGYQSLTNESIINIISDCQLLLKRAYSLLQKAQFIDQLRRDLALHLLSDHTLYRQVLGLNVLSQAVKVKFQHASEEVIAQNIREWMIGNTIFQKIFHVHTHCQLLQRTNSLLEYLVQNLLIDSDQINYLWTMILKYDSHASSILLQILISLAPKLPSKLASLLLKRLGQTAELTQDMISLLGKLVNIGNIQIQEGTHIRIVQLALNEQIKKSIQAKARQIAELTFLKLSSQHRQLMLSFLLQTLLTHCSPKSIGLLKRLINTYPYAEVPGFEHPTNLTGVCRSMCEGEVLGGLLRRLGEEKQDVKLIEQILDLLKLLFQKSYLLQDQVSKKIAEVFSRLGPTNQFIIWLNQVDEDNSFTDQFLNSSDVTLMRRLSMGGVQALEQMFYGVNEREKRLSRNREKSKYFLSCPTESLVGWNTILGLIENIQGNKQFQYLADMLIKVLLTSHQSQHSLAAFLLWLQPRLPLSPSNVLNRWLDFINQLICQNQLAGRGDLQSINCLLHKSDIEIKLKLSEGESLLKVNPKMSLLQLRVLLQESFGPCKIAMGQRLNGFSLHQLKLQNSTLTVEKGLCLVLNKLTDEQGVLEVGLKKILTKEFHNYCNGDLVMTSKELLKFFQAVTGKRPRMQKIEELLQGKQSMNLLEFVQFYRVKSIQSPDVVFKNLARLGYQIFFQTENTATVRKLLSSPSFFRTAISLMGKQRERSCQQKVYELLDRLEFPIEMLEEEEDSLGGSFCQLVPLASAVQRGQLQYLQRLVHSYKQILASQFEDLNKVHFDWLEQVTDSLGHLLVLSSGSTSALQNYLLETLVPFSVVSLQQKQQFMKRVEYLKPQQQRLKQLIVPEDILATAVESIRKNYMCENPSSLSLFYRLAKVLQLLLQNFNLSLLNNLDILQLIDKGPNSRIASNVLIVSLAQKYPKIVEMLIARLPTLNQQGHFPPDLSANVYDFLKILLLQHNIQPSLIKALHLKAIQVLLSYNGPENGHLQGWCSLAVSTGHKLGKEAGPIPGLQLLRKYLFFEGQKVIDLKKAVCSHEYSSPSYFQAREHSTRKLIIELLSIHILLHPHPQFFSVLWTLLKIQPVKPLPKKHAVGISNLGCICYMSSLLQALFFNKGFRKTVQNSEGGVVLQSLREMFCSLQMSKRRNTNPKRVVEALKIDVRLQQDSSQFLNLLFDRLQNQLRGSPLEKALDQLFKGETVTQMICKGCSAVRQIFEPFNYFGVPVKNKQNLTQALESAQQGELISDCYCQNCGSRCDTLRRTLINSLPNEVIIPLQRIVFDMDYLQNMKIHSRLQFPSQIDMEPYTKDGVRLRQTHKNHPDFQQLRLHGKHQHYFKYRLRAVIVHIGRAQAGHYTVYIRHEDKKGQWIKIDDSTASLEHSNFMQRECFGQPPDLNQDMGVFGQSSTNAYVLFYDRLRPQPNITDSLETVFSKHHLQSVLQDNHNFLRELFILGDQFSGPFFKLIQQSFELGVERVQGPDRQELLERLLQWLGVMGRLQGKSNGMLLKSLNRMVEKEPQVGCKLLCKEFLSNVLEIILCQDKNTRSFKNQLMQTLLSKLVYQSALLTPLKQAVSQVLLQLPSRLSKHWPRVDSAFKFLLVSSSNESVFQHLLQTDALTKLLDYYLGRNSPINAQKAHRVGNQTSPVQFSNALLLVHRLIHAHSQNNSFSLPALKCLSCINFYQQALKERQNTCISKIIQEVCTNNYALSKALAKVLLEGLNSSLDMVKIDHFLKSACAFVSIKDKHALQRIYWIFGFPNRQIELKAKHLQRLSEYPSSLPDLDNIQSYLSLLTSQYVFSHQYHLQLFDSILNLLHFSLFEGYWLALPGPHLRHPTISHWALEKLQNLQTKEQQRKSQMLQRMSGLAEKGRVQVLMIEEVAWQRTEQVEQLSSQFLKVEATCYGLRSRIFRCSDDIYNIKTQKKKVKQAKLSQTKLPVVHMHEGEQPFVDDDVFSVLEMLRDDNKEYPQYAVQEQQALEQQRVEQIQSSSEQKQRVEVELMRSYSFKNNDSRRLQVTVTVQPTQLYIGPAVFSTTLLQGNKITLDYSLRGCESWQHLKIRVNTSVKDHQDQTPRYLPHLWPQLQQETSTPQKFMCLVCQKMNQPLAKVCESCGNNLVQHQAVDPDKGSSKAQEINFNEFPQQLCESCFSINEPLVIACKTCGASLI